MIPPLLIPSSPRCLAKYIPHYLKPRSQPLLLLILSVALLANSITYAGSSKTQLIVQPILAHGDAQSWSGDHYKIVDIPYYKKHYNGHPAYTAIAQPNTILSSAKETDPPLESNMLAMMKVDITYNFENTQISVDLTQVVDNKAWGISAKDAGIAALECIRQVAHRYNHKPTVIILPPEISEAFWLTQQTRLSKHDFSKPFKKLQE